MPDNSNSVLQYVREKDPKLKDVSDTNLTAYIKDRFPDLYTAMAPFKQLSTSQVARQRLAKNKADTLQAESKETGEETGRLEKELGVARGVLRATPYAATAAATGGLSTVPGLLASGAAGVAGGVLDKLAMAKGGDRQSGKEIAKDLSWDAIWGMAGEGVGRGVGLLGKTIVPKLIESASGITRLSKDALSKHIGDTTLELINKTATQWVDIGSHIQTTTKQIQKLSKMSPTFEKFIDDVGSQLNIAGGKSSTHQRLSQLIEVQEHLTSLVKNDSITNTERAIVSKLRTGLLTSVENKIATNTQPVKDLWGNLKDALKTQDKNSSAEKLVENTTSKLIKSLGSRAAAGAGIGGAYGAYQGKSVKSAAIGAGVGAAATGLASVAPQAIEGLSKVILQQISAHPQAVGVFKKAVDIFDGSLKGSAVEKATSAAIMSGARDTIRAYLKLLPQQQTQ